MKKFILSICVLLVALQVSAQPRSMGLTGGCGLEISYQLAVGGDGFVELNMGLMSDAKFPGLPAYYPGMRFSASYDAILLKKGGSWGRFIIYLGGGAGLAMHDDARLTANIFVHHGMEYTIPKFPVAVGFTLRPCVGPGKESSVIALEPQTVLPMWMVRLKF